MKYEKQLLLAEKQKWVDLGVTIGSDEALIIQNLGRFKSFISKFDQDQIIKFNQLVGSEFNPDSPLSLDNNPTLLKAFLIKRFIDQHGLEVIKEARTDLPTSENQIFIELLNDLLIKNIYPEDIYVYAVYRQRGTPNTWLKIIGNYTPDQVQNLFDSKLRSLSIYLNKKLGLSRKLRFMESVAGLRIYMFTKPLDPKVFIGFDKNIEVPRGSFTLIIFDREKMRIGVVTGSKKEVLMLQVYIRKYLLPDSIGIPRSDIRSDGKDLFKKLIRSYPENNLTLQSVSFKNFSLPGNPKLELKTDVDDSIDAALDALSSYFENLTLENLGGVEFQASGKNISVYMYGEDDWGRRYINVSAKRKSAELEEGVLQSLETILGVNIKTSKFLTKELTPTFIINKIIQDKKISSLPLPEEVEKIIVSLISNKIITKQIIAKRRCQHCYTFSWNQWECPNCNRETMVIVGEVVKITPDERNILKILSEKLSTDLPSSHIFYLPTKQRDKYRKGVIRVYDSTKNISVFILLILNKKDIKFAQSLLEEGFGVVAILDPDLIGKEDAILSLGCTTISLADIVCYLIGESNYTQLAAVINDQEQKQVERIFANFKTSLDRLKNKPDFYNEAFFEVDVKNIIQAIVPDVIRLGTEYKGKSVPDGYCCYGYRQLRRKRRLFGWDAKYSMSSNYTLDNRDCELQKKYINWLTDPKKEPYSFGKLGIYAFITNSANISGFNTALEKIASSSVFPKQARLAFVEDKLLVEISEWMLTHWQQIIDNNSVIADILFKWFRRKLARSYNILTSNQWNRLKQKLDTVTG